MPLIGDFNLQNVRPNFYIKINKIKIKNIDVYKFLNSGVFRNLKEVFLFLKSESLIGIQTQKYRRFHCETRVSDSVGERVGVQNFLDNHRTAQTKISLMLASPSAA